MTQILRCRWCRRNFQRPRRRGRAPSYCSTLCQRRSERARRAAPTDRTLDDTVSSLAREHLALARRLAQAAAAIATAQPDEDVAVVLGLITELGEDLEDLRAHAVLQARTRKVPWAAIGQLTGWAADTAMRRWGEAYAARRRGLREVRKQRTRLAGEGSTHVPVPPPAAAHRSPPATEVLLPSATADYWADGGVGTDPEGPAVALPEPSLRTSDEPLAMVGRAKLASALSHLHRRSGRTFRELAAAAGVTPSFVSRVLNSERFPSWSVAGALAMAMGGSPAEIRPLWDAGSGVLPQRPFVPSPGSEAAYVGAFVAAIRGLHLAAAAPDPLAISDSSCGRLSPTDAAALISGSSVPDWPAVEVLLEVLGADPAFVLPLWERVQLARGGRTEHPTGGGHLPAEAFG
ncbi:helix-turn-helix domain-containing protein [Streptomyces kaniharaensis]|uniref:helix-turn-helix domain-containing protein n=1 Tax=Streptomyces kaniharaensis TaxID=212423 RepID=UPI0018A82358|nr:helix-turn-helix transcriptional regulator [Streptomyces kaniharaensis]